jgi:hypothetical protein
MPRITRIAPAGALGAVLLAASMMAQAAQPAERELLGVRIWRDYATVLKTHGEPTRVVPGMALPPEIGVGSINVNMQAAQYGGAMAPRGPMMGSSMGMVGPPGMPMGAMSSAGMMGRSMPTAGGGQSIGGGGMGRVTGAKSEDQDDIGAGSPVGGSAPRAGGTVTMPGAGGMSGMVTPPQYGSSAGMVSPVLPGPGMMGGLRGVMPGGMTMPGGGAAMLNRMGGQVGAQSQIQAALPSEEVKETWVYVKGQQTNYFMFNKDGRVIRIQSFGTAGSAKTSRSIGLGDPVSRVYAKYGWADKTIRQGDSLTLDYSQKYHVVFDLLDRHDGKGMRVVGITIAPSEGRS